MGMFTFDCVNCDETINYGEYLVLIFFENNQIIKIVEGFNDYYGLSHTWKNHREWTHVVNCMYNKEDHSGLSCYCKNCWNKKSKILLKNSTGHQNFTDEKEVFVTPIKEEKN